MLEFRDIKVELGAFHLAADFRVESGAKLAVVGPSGAGKSTLLAIAGGFVEPNQGSVLWRDQPLDHLAPGARPISFLFQDNNLFPHMDVARNVGLGIRPDLRLTRSDRDRVAEALSAVGLDGLRDRKPASLSGGQRARVALARILVQAAPVVLLDEPFGALGPAMRSEMIDLSREVGTRLEATMLMVSHNLDDVSGFADGVIWVEDGVCNPPRALDAFLADPPEGFVRYAGLTR